MNPSRATINQLNISLLSVRLWCFQHGSKTRGMATPPTFRYDVSIIRLYLYIFLFLAKFIKILLSFIFLPTSTKVPPRVSCNTSLCVAVERKLPEAFGSWIFPPCGRIRHTGGTTAGRWNATRQLTETGSAPPGVRMPACSVGNVYGGPTGASLCLTLLTLPNSCRDCCLWLTRSCPAGCWEITGKYQHFWP